MCYLCTLSGSHKGIAKAIWSQFNSFEYEKQKKKIIICENMKRKTIYMHLTIKSFTFGFLFSDFKDYTIWYPTVLCIKIIRKVNPNLKGCKYMENKNQI